MYAAAAVAYNNGQNQIGSWQAGTTPSTNTNDSVKLNSPSSSSSSSSINTNNNNPANNSSSNSSTGSSSNKLSGNSSWVNQNSGMLSPNLIYSQGQTNENILPVFSSNGAHIKSESQSSINDGSSFTQLSVSFY